MKIKARIDLTDVERVEGKDYHKTLGHLGNTFRKEI